MNSATHSQNCVVAPSPATFANRSAASVLRQRDGYATTSHSATKRMCLDKIGYDTVDQAAAAVAHQGWLRGQELHIYRCGNCDGFHLTSSQARRANTVDASIPRIDERHSALMPRGRTKIRPKKRAAPNPVTVATDAEMRAFFEKYGSNPDREILDRTFA
jgi:hypothetical protein